MSDYEHGSVPRKKHLLLLCEVTKKKSWKQEIALMSGAEIEAEPMTRAASRQALKSANSGFRYSDRLWVQR